MKKYSVLILLSIIVVALIITNYSQYNKVLTTEADLVKAEEQVELAKNEIKSLEKQVETVENESVRLTTELADNQKLLVDANEELLAVNTQLQAINDKLKTSYNPLQKIDELILENTKWKEELNLVTDSLTELEEQISVSDDTSIASSEDKDQWLADIDDVIGTISKRIAELEALSSNLPTLSLEKVMIGTEIDYLNDVIEELKMLKNNMTKL